MQPPPAPRFYVTPRQPLSSGVVLLAVALAFALLFATRYVLSHSRTARALAGGSQARSAAAGSQDDEHEDLSTVETIYLGDPDDAPTPVRPGQPTTPQHTGGSVHPFVIVRLPRFGKEAGLIADTPSGRLLYSWLAAFNHADSLALSRLLPNTAPDATRTAQMELRQQSGGFNLLSTQEVQPGLLVFRLRAQDPAATEVLGTLQMLPDSNPPAIASFSLRAIPQPDRVTPP